MLFFSNILYPSVEEKLTNETWHVSTPNDSAKSTLGSKFHDMIQLVFETEVEDITVLHPTNVWLDSFYISPAQIIFCAWIKVKFRCSWETDWNISRNIFPTMLRPKCIHMALFSIYFGVFLIRDICGKSNDVRTNGSKLMDGLMFECLRSRSAALVGTYERHYFNCLAHFRYGRTSSYSISLKELSMSSRSFFEDHSSA